MQRAEKIAFYIPNLAGGGAERMTLLLAQKFAALGYPVDLVLNRKKGPYIEQVPNGLRVVELRRAPLALARLQMLRAFPNDGTVLARSILFARKPLRTLSKLPSLARYLGQERPAVMISGLWYANLLTVWARALARVDTRVIVTARNTLLPTINENRSHAWRARRAPQVCRLVRRLYARADAIVSVSDGVADDLAAATGLDRAGITTIYNPVVSPALAERADEPLDHAWFSAGAPPVLLAAGRLNTQKNFSSLLEAFARVRASRRARLIILGEGPKRAALEALVERLGVRGDVLLPGWVDNPHAYMHRAGVFVLSSRWEGLPGVVIEALACGCPVVAADCPSGPREILADGDYGALVPVDDPGALARAIDQTLDAPRDADRLRARAGDFSVAAGVNAYRRLVDEVLDR